MAYDSYTDKYRPTLPDDAISKKYRVRVKYEHIVEEHDGYCSDTHEEFEYHSKFSVDLPLPLKLDMVADAINETHGCGNSDKDNNSDGYLALQANREHASSLELSFPSTAHYEWTVGKATGNLIETYRYIDNDVADGRQVGNSRNDSLPELRSAYFFFYTVKEGCRHGSGYCGRCTKYEPQNIYIVRI